MTLPILLFAVGNESRGDDALAPVLLRQLQTKPSLQTVFTQQVECLEDFQLQIEHALDFRQRQLILFLDAGMDTRTPFDFYRAQPTTTPVLFSHAISPEALLAVYTHMETEAPPPCFVLCLRGERFELGEGLSASAEQGLLQASDFIELLLKNIQLDFWQAHCFPR